MSPLDCAFAPSLPKTALVTGGAQRIGRVLCVALARAGFDVAVHYRHSQAQAEQLVQELQSFGVRACAVQADLDDATSAGALLAQARAQLGVIGVLVNNASMFEYDALTQQAPLSVELFEQHWRANTFAPMLLTQQLAQQLPLEHTGVVVNLLDQKLCNPNPDFLSYTLSKAALAQATVLAAQALAPRIRVMGIAPGLSLRSGEQSDADFAQKHNQTILQRGSTPEDLAHALLYILSAPSMTGTTLMVDGGQHLTASTRDVMFLP